MPCSCVVAVVASIMQPLLLLLAAARAGSSLGTMLAAAPEGPCDTQALLRLLRWLPCHCFRHLAAKDSCDDVFIDLDILLFFLCCCDWCCCCASAASCRPYMPSPDAGRPAAASCCTE